MNATLRLENQTLFVSGAIDFDNAEQVYRQGINLMGGKTMQGTQLDLSQLTSSNTISLAVFVQWLRNCTSTQQMKMVNVPPKMRDIIEASSLLEPFGL